MSTDTSYMFHGGSIYTMNPAQPWAQAVVVRGGDITYVGTVTGAREHTDSGTEEVDLNGGMLLPGFIDSHDHFANMALTKLGVGVRGLMGKEAILARIKEWVDSQPADAPLRGYGWFPDMFEERSPRREWLDEITGDRPMAILSGDAHDLWFNTAAMKAAGLGADSPDPDPGSQYYVRDEDAVPTGHAVEAAASTPLLYVLGYFTPEAIRDSQELTITPAPSYGITTYMEAGVVLGQSSDESEPVYQDLVDRDNAGELPIRIVGTVWTREQTDDPQVVANTLSEWNQRLRSEHVQVSICKMWSDGTMMSGGALLLEAYCNEPGNHGSMTFDKSHITAQIAAVQAAGFDMHIHTDADGSVRTVLDAYEEALNLPGAEGRRHAIAHNSMVHPDDLGRYAQMGVIANCTPLWGTDYDGTYYDIYAGLIGEERMEERLFPYGDLLRAGAVVTFGADIPGVDIQEIPPLIQIQAAVTRRRPGFPDERALVERQRMDLADALRCYTINGAYQLRLEDQIGSIEAGKKADLVYLGQDLFRVDPEKLYEVPVLLTMMDGRITHDAR